MKKLLITGFAPFGGEAMNPSWEAVRGLPERVGEYEIVKLEVPVVFGQAGDVVLQAAQACHPDVILCIGQAGGRKAVTPERIGINLRLAGIPDNAGNQPAGELVVPCGPDGLFATVPVEDMAAAIRDAGVPGAVSNSAGTYVCNDLLYTLLHHFRGTNTRTGFIHVPFLPEQAGEGTASMTLEDMKKALTAAIEAL